MRARRLGSICFIFFVLFAGRPCSRALSLVPWSRRSGSLD